MIQTEPLEDPEDFIFYTGDTPWGDDIFDTHSRIKKSITDKFPNTPLFFCLGNHDFDGDMNPSGDDAKKMYPR